MHKKKKTDQIAPKITNIYPGMKQKYDNIRRVRKNPLILETNN